MKKFLLRLVDAWVNKKISVTTQANFWEENSWHWNNFILLCSDLLGIVSMEINSISKKAKALQSDLRKSLLAIAWALWEKNQWSLNAFMAVFKRTLENKERFLITKAAWADKSKMRITFHQPLLAKILPKQSPIFSQKKDKNIHSSKFAFEGFFPPDARQSSSFESGPN